MRHLVFAFIFFVQNAVFAGAPNLIQGDEKNGQPSAQQGSGQQSQTTPPPQNANVTNTTPPGTPKKTSSELADVPQGEEIAVPILVKSADGKEEKGGFISVEATPQRPDALQILRAELQRQEMESQARAQKDGVFISTTKRFAPESLTFFIAIGGVTFSSMWIKSHGDPLALERHIMSLKDPIAHLSFYAFMQSQGFYMNFHTGSAKFHAMDPSTRNQFMRRLSYQGMAIGSFASSVVSDLGHSAKMCADKWIKGKRDSQSLAVCDQAWQQWTVRNKFQQYFPQIISMWAAQAATEFAEHTISMGFERVAASAWVKKILTKDFLVRQAYKISAADVATSFVGGGWVTKSIKFVGKLTKFAGFVAVDHVLSNYTYRPINNIIKPLLFEWDAANINHYWAQADAGNWDSSKIANKKNLEKFEKEVEDYGKQMQGWRDHLNMDAEGDLAGWMEMTKKILNQVDYAYKYYQTFADTLYENLSTGHKIRNGELAPSAAAVISRYPLRMLPFYGVRPGPYKAVNGQLEDLYLLNPNELEMRQKEHVLAMAAKYRDQVSKIRKQQDAAEYNQIIAKLASADNMKMASGLNDINGTIDLYELEMRQEHPYSLTSYEFIAVLRQLRSELGKPQPVVYPLAGYTQAFTAYSPNMAIASSADYSKWSIWNKYKFNKEADLMLFKLICGKSQGRLYKVDLAGVNILSPQYEPPTLLRANPDRDSFCSSIQTTNGLYGSKIAGMNLQDYVLKNLNYAAIGDFRAPRPDGIFENWWVKNAKEPLNKDFMEWDVKFKKAFESAYNNFFDNRGFYKWLVDHINQSLYLPKSLEGALKAETDTYLQILARTLVADNVKNPKFNETPMPGETPSLWSKVKDGVRLATTGGFNAFASSYYNGLQLFNYLEFSTKDSEQNKFTPMYGKAPTEIYALYSLFNQYHQFIRNPNVNFEQYIAHSKRIDTAINDALVALGLRRIKQGPSLADDIEDFSNPSKSGTEVSAKEYEDVPIANPTYKQRMGIAAVRGLRLVESEIRRFIRMRIALSQSLVVDNAELMADWNNANPTQRRDGKFNPFGGR